MKTRLLAVTFSLFGFAQLAQARYIGPLLTKTKYPSGFVSPGIVQNKVECGIYYNRVELVITQFKDGQQIGRNALARPFDTDEPVYQWIDEAAQGEIVRYPGPYDIPGSLYKAYQIQPADGVKEVLLLKHMGNGSIDKNESSEAESLVRILDTHCSEANVGE